MVTIGDREKLSSFFVQILKKGGGERWTLIISITGKPRDLIF